MIKKLLKFLKVIFILIVTTLVAVIGYGAYNHFKAQSQNKKTQNSNYVIHEKEEKSNKDKIIDNVKNFFNRKKDKSEASSFTEDDNKSNNNDINVPAEYNTYNFDDSILLFEGEQKGNRIIELLDRLIKNADDDLYTNTKVTIRNINSSSETIEYSYNIDNKEEYKGKLNNVKNFINSDNNYIVSFGYSKYKSHVNEIIIEKK